MYIYICTYIYIYIYKYIPKHSQLCVQQDLVISETFDPCRDNAYGVENITLMTLIRAVAVSAEATTTTTHNMLWKISLAGEHLLVCDVVDVLKRCLAHHHQRSVVRWPIQLGARHTFSVWYEGETAQGKRPVVQVRTKWLRMMI